MKDKTFDSCGFVEQTDSNSSLEYLLENNSIIKKLTLNFVSISIFKPQKKQVLKQLYKENFFQIAPSYCERKKVDKHSLLKRYIPVYLAELEPQDQAEMEIRYFWILPDMSMLVADFHSMDKLHVSSKKSKPFLIASNACFETIKQNLKFEQRRTN